MFKILKVSFQLNKAKTYLIYSIYMIFPSLFKAKFIN